MKICIGCGKDIENTRIICPECEASTDMEELCRKVISFDIKSCDDPVLLRAAKDFREPNAAVRNLVFPLSENLEESRKQYLRFSTCPNKIGIKWLLEKAPVMLEGSLDDNEKNQVKRQLMKCQYSNFKFHEAEKYARELLENNNLDSDMIYDLAEFFKRTRRYEQALEILGKGKEKYTDGSIAEKYDELWDDIKKRQNGGKVEYMPKLPENKELYIEFMKTLGFDVKLPEKKTSAPMPADKSKVKLSNKKTSAPTPMDKANYPDFFIERNGGFKTFVAFDLETTGLRPEYDCITEIGAVRVVNGVVEESERFIFQTFVRPFKKSISSEVTKLTGITNEMVANAPQMWEAFDMFADFAEDDILVGFNNEKFDNRFLARAGRYAHRIMNNKFFDVMVYSRYFKDKLKFSGSNVSLETLSKLLKIKNPRAHRAEADALTTARVYLKLAALDDRSDDDLMESMLDDDWS